MNTKEKLEIAWKYLALILVAAIAFAWLETTHFIGGPKKGEFVFIGDKNHDFYGNEQKMMDVKVEKEIVDGDTLVKMWINGEEVDAEEHDMNDGSFKWKSKDGKNPQTNTKSTSVQKRSTCKWDSSPNCRKPTNTNRQKTRSVHRQGPRPLKINQ